VFNIRRTRLFIYSNVTTRCGSIQIMPTLNLKHYSQQFGFKSQATNEFLQTESTASCQFEGESLSHGPSHDPTHINSTTQINDSVTPGGPPLCCCCLDTEVDVYERGGGGGQKWTEH